MTDKEKIDELMYCLNGCLPIVADEAKKLTMMVGGNELANFHYRCLEIIRKVNP